MEGVIRNQVQHRRRVIGEHRTSEVEKGVRDLRSRRE